MNVQQLYLDLCTSWQSEPVYKDDVMLILEKIGKKLDKKHKLEDPDKIIQINVPVSSEYRLSACFNILFSGHVIFKTRLGAVQKMMEELG